MSRRRFLDDHRALLRAGHLSITDEGPVVAIVGPLGAKALLRVLEERQESSTTTTVAGAIDGTRRSIGALWFTPDGLGAIEAAVPSPELMEEAVQHDAANQRVRAEFDVVTIIGKGANPRRRQIYTLRSIEPLPDAPTLI